MALTREQKEERLKQYSEMLAEAQAVLFADYRGLRMGDMQELRRELREEQTTFMVVKNTLFRMALQERGVKVPDALLEGPLAVAFVPEEPVGAAKVLVKFAQNTKILQVRGGLLGGQFVEPAAVEALSELPSREVLLAQVVGAMQSPIAGLVNVLAGPMRGLMNVLNARSSQLQEAA